MDINLDEMELSELKALKKQLAKEIANFEQRERKEAIAAVRDFASERGFNLDELMVDFKKRPRAKVEPKYAHPENPSLTWSGRGRRPKWVVAHQDGGGSLDDLLI